MSLRLVLLGALILGCKDEGNGDTDPAAPPGPDGVPTGTPTGGTTPPDVDPTTEPGTTPTPCATQVERLYPTDGAIDAYYRSTIEVEVSEVDLAATLDVWDAAGVVVTGQTAWRGRTLVFTPDAPLEPLSLHNATVTSCAGSTSWTFTTTEVGSPMVADPEGRTYALDLFSGRILEPAGIGPLIQAAIEELEWLAETQSVDGDTIDWLMAKGDGNGGQDMCSASVSVLGADFSEDPHFTFGPTSLVFTVDDVTIDVQDAWLSGDFAPDASSLDGVVLAGLLDTRPMVDLVMPGGPDDAVCNMAAALGISCVACPDGQLLCLEMYVDGLHADQVTGAGLVPLTEDQVAADPTCP